MTSSGRRTRFAWAPWAGIAIAVATIAGGIWTWQRFGTLDESLETRQEVEPPPRRTLRTAQLTSERFARKHATLGMWDPAQFESQGQAGIYQLEKASSADNKPATSSEHQGEPPGEQPKESRATLAVIYIHGFVGTPRDFVGIHHSGILDPPAAAEFAFFYPTSIALTDASATLRRSLDLLLAETPDLKRLALVAHSMGGLVAMHTFGHLSREPLHGEIPIDLITIATPFGGMDSAAFGAKFSPVAMPSWLDLSPKSEFLRALATEIPSTQTLEPNRYFAIHGNLPDNDGDGTVPLSSQQGQPFLQLASDTLTVPANHTEILKHARTLDTLRSWLIGNQTQRR